MKEIFYKFNKNKQLVNLNKKEKEIILDYIGRKESYGFGSIPPKFNFISFNYEGKGLMVNFWTGGTCVTFSYKEMKGIFDFIKDENELISKLTSELV